MACYGRADATVKVGDVCHAHRENRCEMGHVGTERRECRLFHHRRTKPTEMYRDGVKTDDADSLLYRGRWPERAEGAEWRDGAQPCLEVGGPTMPNSRFTDGRSERLGRTAGLGKVAKSCAVGKSICMVLWVHTQKPNVATRP